MFELGAGYISVKHPNFVQNTYKIWTKFICKMDRNYLNFFLYGYIASTKFFFVKLVFFVWIPDAFYMHFGYQCSQQNKFCPNFTFFGRIPVGFWTKSCWFLDANVANQFLSELFSYKNRQILSKIWQNLDKIWSLYGQCSQPLN